MIYALLDEGSTVSIINSDIIKNLGIKSSKINVTLKGIGNVNSLMICSEKVDLQISTRDHKFLIKNVLVVKNLALTKQDVNSIITDYCFRKTGIKVIPFNSIPDMLIGQDNCDLIVSREIRRIDNDRFLVSRTLLGWSIHGNLYTNKVKQVNTLRQVQVDKNYTGLNENDDNLDKLIRSYFDIEALGIIINVRKNPEEERAMQILENTSKYINGEWEVGLLWKHDEIINNNSKITARSKLKTLERKLDRDKEHAILYYKEINRLFVNNFAEKCTQKALGNRVWFLPHFGVENINKPGKVRLVFDAAARTTGVSFNDLLLAGPDLLKSLPGVLMRFRQFAYALKADLRDMFLKIKIRKEDRDAQRFLWRGENREKDPEEYVMSSMLFGAKSSPCTALFIKNKNALHYSSRFPKTVNSLITNCYMDDFLDSCETVVKPLIVFVKLSR